VEAVGVVEDEGDDDDGDDDPELHQAMLRAREDKVMGVACIAVRTP
jgi:hypothetical protein